MPPRKKAAAAVAGQHAVSTRSSRSKTKAAAEASLGGAECSVANSSKPTVAAAGGEAAGAGSGSRAMTKKGSNPQELSPPAPKPSSTAKKAATALAKQPKQPGSKKQGPKASTTKTPAHAATKGTAQTAFPARATPPTESSVEPENSNSTYTPPNNSVTRLSDVAGNLTLGRMRKRSLDLVDMNSINNTKETDATRHKKAKTGASVAAAAATTKKRGTRKYTPFTAQNVEAWFEQYRDDGKEEVMSPAACSKWMEELGMSEESAAFYVLAWKLDAKTMFTIGKQEFVEGMKKLGYDDIPLILIT